MEADWTITRLPDLTFDNLEAIMTQRIEAVKTDQTVIPMLWQGLLELRIQVNGAERTAKLFVPRDTPQGTVFVLMNVPEGEETVLFLQKSGWMQKAAENGFCLFVLEPACGGWGTLGEELPYLFAGFQAEIQGIYCLPAFAMYVAGYGAIGVGLHKAVMRDPLHVAAAAFFDAGAVDDAYQKEYREKTYDRYGVPFHEVPVPVWITEEAMNVNNWAMADYWRTAAHIGKASPFTTEGDILRIVAQEKKYDPCDPRTTDEIYNFLSGWYRYGMGPCSNIISRRVDYRALGAERKSFTDSSGIRREYLAYVPEKWRGVGKKLPMVVALHGASQSMRNMLENGLWYRIADREGVILVVPECTLEPLPSLLHGGTAYAYRPLWTLFENDPVRHHRDMQYIDELLDRAIAEFPVDERRIYCTGHSMGCMMTNYLGSGKVSHRFAALGAMCGILQGREDTGTQKIPVFLTMGEYDLWDYHIEADTQVTDALDMWLLRNDLADEKTVREVRVNGAIAWRDGRRHHYAWQDGNGISWLRYAWVEKRDHTNSPEENEMLWSQWFSKWSIGEDGHRHYTGERFRVKQSGE